ncbi:MAG: NUDIX hydrolase [Gammaproteobacteria bacterium]|nr:NUDIX hydrolase [Gammaproteobacteria bacterium]
MVSGLYVNDSLAKDLPEGYWSLEQATEVQNKTRKVMLDPDLSSLSDAELAAVEKLIKVGVIFNRLYEDSIHPQALDSLQKLKALDNGGEHTTALLDIYYRSKGPITTTLDNRRVAIIPVAPEEPGKNVYPQGMTNEILDPYLQVNPDRAARLLNLRTVVRSNNEKNISRDLKMLNRFPLLDGLHPNLRSRLEALQAKTDDSAWYALPYSVRWAPDIMQAYELINAAANDVRTDDPDLSAYLSLRARDIVSDDYEAGDAAWVRGKFRHLNAQIGSYEVYPDSLYGVKSFFSLNVLIRDTEKSNELTAALGGLQAIQDALPVRTGRKIQQDIPVGVYNIAADFGQSRGSNTATILPNDANHTRKYGRTILLRYNIMTNPGLFEDRKDTFQAAVKPEHANDLTIDGPFYRTLWHEVGHYLGVDKTTDSRELNEALTPWGSHYEEMKADLLSGFTSGHLNWTGVMNDDVFRSVQAASVLRVLQKNQPRTNEQPYQTMQLMQMNYFMEHGFLSFDPKDARLQIHYDRYNEVIRKMLNDVLNIQLQGSSEQASEFIKKYTTWTPQLHGKLAERLREASRYRFVDVRYKALLND